MKTSLRKVWLVAVSVLFMLCISLFVACGAKTYTLTFVTNGGTEIAPITAEAGAEITPPADPEKSGFSFDGWFLSSDFSGDKVTVPSVMPEKDVTYYAKFTENAPEATATLTLDAGIGNLDTTTYQLVIGTNVSQFLKDIVPTVEEGIIFAGWFRGESEVGSSVILPAGGMELTAKYKAKYTIKAYLQGLDGEYVLDENFAEKEGMDWLGSTISADSVPWDAPQFYRVNEELTQSLTLLDGKGVFEIYYDRNTYSVYYLDGAPDGTTVTGTTESQTGIINGNTVIVKENGYSLEGYRFAGWATSLNGPVEYQAGDSIEINGRHVTLYARWNYGATDANGGTDIIYVLAEKAGTVVLERQYREDETGTYEADTRVFTFATDDGQKTLYGRISADGKTFAYFREDVKLTYYWYDWQTSATEPSETVTLELDGIDGAVYTTKDGRKISGTYTPDDGVYKFTADSEDLEFYFALGIASVSDKEDTDVFLIRDEFAGSYDYMNASGNIYQTPTLVIDGFGKAIYTVSEEAMEAVYTILPDGYLEVVYNDNGVEKTVVCNIVGLVDTTAGTQRAVFEISDAARGEYTFEIGEAKEEITVTLDGFGNAEYTYGDTTDETVYVYVDGYSDGTTNWAFFRFALGEDAYTVRFDLAQKEQASLVGGEAGRYGEYNRKSPYTARILLRGDGTAAVELLMQDQSYSALIEGTYAAYGTTGYDYTFTATKYADESEEILAPYYGNFVFRLYSINSSVVFVTSDGVEGAYTFTSDEKEFTLTCNGFGYATLETEGTDPATVAYTFEEGYSDGTTAWNFIHFTVGSSELSLRVENGKTEGTLFSGPWGRFQDLPNNRMPEYTEILQLFADGYAQIQVLVDGEYVTKVEGTYEADSQEQGFFIFTAVRYTDGDNEAWGCYESFRFTYGTAAGYDVFFLYREGESGTFGNLTLTGYGIAEYYGEQYLYTADENYIYLTTVDGSTSITLQRTENGIKEPGTEQGDHYSCLTNEEGQTTIGEYRLTLDGFGKASWYQADSEGKEYTLLAEGTYIGSEEEGYTVTFATAGYEDKGFSFIVTTRTASGYVYPVYILATSELTVEYTIIGGGSVVVDAYGRVTYTDAEGNTYNAILQISEDTVIEGRQKLLLIVYNEDNTGIEAVYIYVIENGTELRPTDGKSGNYALLEGDQIFPDTYIVLDGFGGAVLTVGGKEVAKGTYEPTDGTNEFIFCSETEGTADFTFYLTSVLTVDGTTYSVYIVYEEKWDAQFNSSDWQVILLDGYNSATLIDFNGYAYEVNYELLGESVLHLFGSSMNGRYFNADAETKTFTQITEEFVIENGVLLAYQGAGGKIKIPDEVTEIGPSVFYLAPITSVDLNNVTTIDEYAFQAVMLTEITGTDNVTSIGDYAFYQNIVLASVNFPKVETVGEYAFARSEGLENVSLGASLKSIGKNAFFYCGTYNNAVFTLTLEGTSAPTMGEDVFLNCGKKGCYVAVKDLDTVIAYCGDAKWADYAKYVGIAVKAENGAGNYYTSPASETAASLTLGVQVIFNGKSIGVYELEGNKLSVYLFDGETDVAASPDTGTLTDGVIEINLKETQYKLYIEGSEWTFKNEENTLTIMAGIGTVQGFYNETPISVTLGEEISFILDNRKHIITDLNETDLTFTEELADSYKLRYTNVNSEDYESRFTLEIKGEGTENITLDDDNLANRVYGIDGRNPNMALNYRPNIAWTIESIEDNIYIVSISSALDKITYYVAFIVDNETMTFDYYLVKTVHPEVVADNGAKVELTVFYDIPESFNDTISGTGEIIGLSAIINGEQVTIDSVVEISNGYVMRISEGEYTGTYTIEIKLSTSTGRKITSIKYAV